MRIVAYPGERIEPTFTTTPGHRLGAEVYALSLAVLFVLTWLWLLRPIPRTRSPERGAE